MPHLASTARAPALPAFLLAPAFLLFACPQSQPGDTDATGTPTTDSSSASTGTSATGTPTSTTTGTDPTSGSTTGPSPTSGGDPTGDPSSTTTDPSGSTAGTDTGGPGVDDDPTPEELKACDDGPTGQELSVTPADYKATVAMMQPGDVMRFQPGDYPDGLTITGLHGSAGACYFFEGPAEGPPARFLGSSNRNTVSLRDSSYIVVRRLELDGLGEIGDGLKAEGDGVLTHHIVVEDLHIHDHDGDVQTVGINTKITSWYWVIRRNRIERVGTGIYLGNSNGEQPFIGGLVERNVVLDTLGYNMQVKHQNDRPDLPGLPQAAETIIRHNVFSKQNGGLEGQGARPNLLVGHFPPTGPGANDRYLIYGNFLHDNPTESLFQGEGNIAFYNNVLITPAGAAVRIQPHNDVPKQIDIFFNTIIAGTGGISVSGGDPNFQQNVVGNAVFAATPINGGTQVDNHTGSVADAATVLANPGGQPGVDLDLHPQPGALEGAVDTAAVSEYPSYSLDFDRRPREDSVRGAYAGPARPDAWILAREPKP